MIKNNSAIIGIGIDSVEIERFSHWAQLKNQQLLRIFSQQEISYCLESSKQSAQRFAARFAAREAFFKALEHSNATTHLSCDTTAHRNLSHNTDNNFSTAVATNNLPFLTLCKKIELTRTNHGVPQLIVDWDYIMHTLALEKSMAINSFISITHTRTTATAFVVLEKAHSFIS